MDIEHISKLAEIFSAHGLTSLEVIEGGMRVRLEKLAAYQPSSVQPIATAISVPIGSESGVGAGGQLVDFNRIIEVKSPLVGVFYAAPSPDSETFVSIGSRVKKGDVLCIIETMKLLNEITAEVDGEIVDICVKDGDVVEYGQVLFKIM